MSNSAKESELDGLTFEDAVSQLELSVRRLEGNSLGLEQSLAEYAKAVQYVAYCQGQLETAKRKIEQLKAIAKDGSITTHEWEDTPVEEPKRKRKPS